MFNLFLWILYFPPAILIEVICYILAPIVALFHTTSRRTDVVKRLNKKIVTMDRDYLPKYLYWFQTHDNAVDEWWYGVYNVNHWFTFAQNWTQEDYDNSWFIRYYCRLMWLWRNCAYGFHYNLFSREKESSKVVYEYGDENKRRWLRLTVYLKSFQLEVNIPFLFSRYISINVGWKGHKGASRLMYANRIISFRKDE